MATRLFAQSLGPQRLDRIEWRTILGLFLGEAVVLAVLGGLAGLLAGIGLAQGMRLAVPALPVQTPVSCAVLAVAVSALIGLAAGVLPAHRASRLTTALLGDSSGVTTQETVVLRNAAQWQDLWARHARVMVPSPAAPAQDFSGRQMVGVFLGSRPDGCHAVTVTRVVQREQTVVVGYREQAGGGAGQACTQALTQPHHLVWMPASTLPVEFRPE